MDHQLASLGGKLGPGADRHESGLNFEACFQNESNLRGSNPLPRSDERRFLVSDFNQAFLDLEQNVVEKESNNNLDLVLLGRSE